MIGAPEALKEQGTHGVFPRVCRIMPTSERAKDLERKVKASGRLLPAMFAVTTSDGVLTTVTGGSS